MTTTNGAPMRYPRGPIEALLHDRGLRTGADMAAECGVDYRHWQRAGHVGFSTRAADHLALRLGWHPTEIWSEWSDTEADRRHCEVCGAPLEPNPHGGSPKRYCPGPCRTRAIYLRRKARA